MKKILLLVIALMLCLTVSASAIRTSGPNKFYWIEGDEGVRDGQKTYDWSYSSCVTYTDTPGIVRFSIKMFYTDFGRSYHKIPNVKARWQAYNFNLMTGQIQWYAYQDTDLYGNRGAWNFLNNQWAFPPSGSVIENAVNRIRNQQQCTEYHEAGKEF